MRCSIQFYSIWKSFSVNSEKQIIFRFVVLLLHQKIMYASEKSFNILSALLLRKDDRLFTIHHIIPCQEYDVSIRKIHLLVLANNSLFHLHINSTSQRALNNSMSLQESGTISFLFWTWNEFENYIVQIRIKLALTLSRIADLWVRRVEEGHICSMTSCNSVGFFFQTLMYWKNQIQKLCIASALWMNSYCSFSFENLRFWTLDFFHTQVTTNWALIFTVDQ